ncbi:PSD13 ATPase, partial [Amia calva]|nr:PSD13 ATPase [Amia calva]
MIKWRELDLRLSWGQTLDQIQMTNLEAERKRWRDVLTHLISITQPLAERNLAFRGSTDKLFQPDNGNFLKDVELLAKFDPVMENHLSKIKDGETHAHYLGKRTQNELIQIVSDKIPEAIVTQVWNDTRLGSRLPSFHAIRYQASEVQEALLEARQTINVAKVEERRDRETARGISAMRLLMNQSLKNLEVNYFNIVVNCAVTSMDERFETLNQVKTKYGELLNFQNLPSDKMTAFELLSFLCEKNLEELYPNLWKSLRIAVTLPVTVESAERSFSKLTLIKTLMHPILETLRNGEKQWLIDTLYAFNSGNVEHFLILKDCWGSQTDLAANESKLKEKLHLLCLMEMVFTRPAHHRQITFQEIARQTQISVGEVELLVMKALSTGLVKGSIDEVDSKVYMTWVQPRVMDLKQVRVTP